MKELTNAFVNDKNDDKTHDKKCTKLSGDDNSCKDQLRPFLKSQFKEIRNLTFHLQNKTDQQSRREPNKKEEKEMESLEIEIMMIMIAKTGGAVVTVVIKVGVRVILRPRRRTWPSNC